MKIAIFTARLIYGGGEKVQNWLAHQLLDAGFEIIYFAPVVDISYVEKLKEIGLYGRVDAIEYPWTIKRRHPFRFFREMKRLYSSMQLDAILIFGGSLLEEIAARSTGVKVILAERCNPTWRNLPSRILKQIQYGLGDGFIFQTKEQAECYSRYAQNNCAIILNPIIEERPKPTGTNRKEIVTVGRLSPEKNIIGIINAFARFRETHDGYKLVIYGDGPQEDAILRIIRQKALETFVEIIKGRTNISELIEGASLFVLNSTNEGMPNALVEAMSVGLPCISADCPIYGPRALIDNGKNGILIPINDDNALYKAMCRIIDNPILANQMSINALHIREKLNQKVIARMWVSQITKIIQS